MKWLGLVGLALVALALAVLLGPAHVPLAELGTSEIVPTLGVPRALLGFVVGGSLAVAGAGLQALVRNPLADPFLLGLSGGAGLGAVAAIAWHLGGPWALPLAAFAGALAAMALVFRLGLVGGAELDPRVLLLAGGAGGGVAGAVTTAIGAVSEAAPPRDAVFWLLGGPSGAAWGGLLIGWLFVSGALVTVFAAARALGPLALG